MSHVEQMRARRQAVLAELTGLEEIRRGSIVEQYVNAVHADGSRVRRGPYPLYTYKEKNRTLSRRLTSPEEVERCRRQIQGFRRFEELVGELMRLGEGLSDATGKKTTALKSSGTPKSRGS